MVITTAHRTIAKSLSPLELLGFLWSLIHKPGEADFPVYTKQAYINATCPNKGWPVRYFTSCPENGMYGICLLLRSEHAFLTDVEPKRDGGEPVTATGFMLNIRGSSPCYFFKIDT